MEISVIIPVYNVSSYIKECLSSVLAQTYSDYEVILIDDCCTDNSMGIVQDLIDSTPSYKSKVRIYHHRNNLGLSAARNTGIYYALGKYVTFIDSDDTIDSTYLDQLLKLLKKHDADISSCREYSTVMPQISVCESLYTSKEAIETMLKDEYISPSACAKLYKKELFADTFFPVGIIFEDFATTYKLLFKSKCIVQSNEALYFYRPNPTSIMRSTFSSKYLDIITVHDQVISFLEVTFPDLVSLAKARKTRFCMFMLIKLVKSKSRERFYRTALLKNLKENVGYFLKSHYRITEKILALLFLINYRFAGFLILKRK